MKITFVWMPPALPNQEHSQYELVVENTLINFSFSDFGQKDISVRFVPDTTLSELLLGAVQRSSSGRLLGVIQINKATLGASFFPAHIKLPEQRI